jgi:hypothetical protein
MFGWAGEASHSLPWLSRWRKSNRYSSSVAEHFGAPSALDSLGDINMWNYLPSMTVKGKAIRVRPK